MAPIRLVSQLHIGLSRVTCDHVLFDIWRPIISGDERIIIIIARHEPPAVAFCLVYWGFSLELDTRYQARCQSLRSNRQTRWFLYHTVFYCCHRLRNEYYRSVPTGWRAPQSWSHTMYRNHKNILWCSCRSNSTTRNPVIQILALDARKHSTICHAHPLLGYVDTLFVASSLLQCSL